MSAENDKYRNPSPPPGYVRKKDPEIVYKDGIDIDGVTCKFMDFIIDSGILDVPDISIYENFVINSSSEEEEIIEVPVESCPKVIEVIDIDVDVAHVSDTKKDIPIAIKKEVEPLASSDTYKEIDTKVLASMPTKITLKTEPSSDKKEKIIPEKKIKKHDRSSGRSSRGKKNKDRRDTYDSDSDAYSKKSIHKKDDINKDSYKKVKHKKKDGYESSKSYSHKIRPKQEIGYNSDDSENSSWKISRRQHTPLPSCSKEYMDEKPVANIKEEIQPGLLYGIFPCKVCNISMNSSATYESHITGKKHQKALNAQNVVETVNKTFVHTEAASKCPKPPPGFYRMQLDVPAKIQRLMDENLKPCPGLDNVTEIQGIFETSYYCQLCDSHCNANSILPHLSGFKHQLNCLKHFRSDLYQQWCYKQKYQIEKQVADELRAIEKKLGKGLLKVEKDYSETDNPNHEIEMACWRDTSMPSTSQQASDLSDVYAKFSQPDPSKSGYYCKLCDSHSNSEHMWQNHITGKRHLKNLKKAPGAAPSKSKYIAAPNVMPHLLKLLRNVHEPVVGLDQIREIRKPEINGITYNCFLCSSCIASVEIVDHILSRKHREKYLDNIDHPELETVRNCQVSVSSVDSIIQEICANVEAKMGRGEPEVYYAKNALRKG